MQKPSRGAYDLAGLHGGLLAISHDEAGAVCWCWMIVLAGRAEGRFLMPLSRSNEQGGAMRQGMLTK